MNVSSLLPQMDSELTTAEQKLLQAARDLNPSDLLMEPVTDVGRQQEAQEAQEAYDASFDRINDIDGNCERLRKEFLNRINELTVSISHHRGEYFICLSDGYHNIQSRLSLALVITNEPGHYDSVVRELVCRIAMMRFIKPKK